jgi:hypothetical protein
VLPFEQIAPLRRAARPSGPANVSLEHVNISAGRQVMNPKPTHKKLKVRKVDPFSVDSQNFSGSPLKNQQSGMPSVLSKYFLNVGSQSPEFSPASNLLRTLGQLQESGREH